jgi:uncharacterized protein YbbK (DUF523 family)
MGFPKPVVVVSKCLGFAHCRYNGQIISDREIESLSEFVQFRPVCPEVEIGLDIPRDPVRIVESEGKRHLFQPATGRDVSGEMYQFTATYLDSAVPVDGFILKNRSPSCGPWDVKIYNSFNKDAGIKRGNGLFGGKVFEKYPTKAIEDEGRLKNFTIREHFLTNLFTKARFREVNNKSPMNTLVTPLTCFSQVTKIHINNQCAHASLWGIIERVKNRGKTVFSEQNRRIPG